MPELAILIDNPFFQCSGMEIFKAASFHFSNGCGNFQCFVLVPMRYSVSVLIHSIILTGKNDAKN